jgi:hypothetical protein
MKIPVLACMSLFSVVACTAQQSSPTWLGADPNAGPVHVGGSAANTTTAFDGTYRGISNSSASAASHLTATGTGAKTVDVTTTPCHQFDELPTLTVKNGLAQFQALGATFAGYVTPQGQLTLHSGYGVTLTGQGQPVDVDENFDGIIDYQTHVLRAKVSSVNCTYNVAWQRVT